MAVCVQQDSQGYLFVVIPQPADLSTCSHVLQSSAEYLNNPLALTAEDGQTLGYSIMLVWAIAYAGRLVLELLSDAGNESARS